LLLHQEEFLGVESSNFLHLFVEMNELAPLAVATKTLAVVTFAMFALEF